MYKAEIEFIAVKDDYENGEELTADNVWYETLTADTQSELRNKILDITYSKWTDLNDEKINEYDWCTEYHTSYLANADNEGNATEREIKQWKQGELELWAINCHICVTEVLERKAELK